MADILLAHANHLYRDRKQARKMEPYPPLQTLIAAALLRQEGFDVALFDATLVAPEEGFRAAIGQHRPALVVLCEDNFNFLTKMCLTRNRESAFAMCRIAGQEGIPVLVNSSDATQRPSLYLQNGLDCVILGEVEITLIETARVLLGRVLGNLDDIRGLARIPTGSGRIRCNPPREPLRALDRLPMPAWDLVDMDSYRAAWKKTHGYFALSLVSSRGCPFRCNWCAKPIHGQGYQVQSAERTAKEMLLLKTVYMPDRVWFADDIFALSAPWAMSFADAVERLDARIPFKMQSRCDLMTRDTVAALRRAGCVEVWMGAESGSQRILDAMDKGTRVREVYNARATLARNGIRACYFLQFGYPGETWDDIRQTIRMIRETDPDEVGISVSYPLPGTDFYRRVAAELGPKQNWADSEDLSMIFRGTYSNDFYRALHDAVHSELDWRKAAHHDANDKKPVREIWDRVEALEKTAVNPAPTPVWISC